MRSITTYSTVLLLLAGGLLSCRKDQVPEPVDVHILPVEVSAVFVLEDDAQNGADHVDAHRSIAYVVSPYTRRRFADHTMYSTNSMLRTIELILGMPPMSQQNAAATPMWKCFTAQADFSPWKARPCNVNLDDRNAAVNDLQRRSENFDMSQEDRVPDLEFNEVLWKAIKGLDSEMPAPRRAAFVRLGEKKDDDDYGIKKKKNCNY